MYANLSFADLEGGLILISLDDGTIGFFLVKLKYFLVEILFGKYLEEFFTSEYSLKKTLLFYPQLNEK